MNSYWKFQGNGLTCQSFKGRSTNQPLVSFDHLIFLRVPNEIMIYWALALFNWTGIFVGTMMKHLKLIVFRMGLNIAEDNIRKSMLHICYDIMIRILWSTLIRSHSLQRIVPTSERISLLKSDFFRPPRAFIQTVDFLLMKFLKCNILEDLLTSFLVSISFWISIRFWLTCEYNANRNKQIPF